MIGISVFGDLFLDIDECSMTNPCLHGGTCTNTIGGYRCFCPPEWTGDICETGKWFKILMNVA